MTTNATTTPVAPAPPTQPFVAAVQSAATLVQPGPMPQLNWSHFKPEFKENQMKMQKHIFLRQMIGWTLMHFQMVSKSKDFVKL